ncbi:MAG: hypothetical protein ACI9TY_000126 [Alphaproteobacteria bacterium]|jgi:hypothetical protein
MSLIAKVSLFAALIMHTANADAASLYEQKQQICKAIMQEIDLNLSQITDRDRIKDNKHISKAALWSVSYQQYHCNPEVYLNSLRRTLK